MQCSGGGIRQIFNVRNNNKKSFAPDLFQEKLQPLQSSFVPGDEPLKFIDSQHSKQVAVQKRFYQKGLYKQKGRFLRALTHILETNKLSSDDDSIATPVTSNNSTIDISNIDFNIPSKKLKVMIPPQSPKSRSDFCDNLFQDEASIPKEIMDTIQLFTDDNDLNPLLESDSYTNVIYCIEVMDNELGKFNNGDLDTDWYDVVDISAVRLRTEFIKEGFSNSDIYHEENFENNSVVNDHADTIGIEDATIQANSTTVPGHVNKFSFYDDPRAQMDEGAKCSVTNIVEILRNVTRFDQHKQAPVCMRGATSEKIIVQMAKGWL